MGQPEGLLQTILTPDGHEEQGTGDVHELEQRDTLSHGSPGGFELQQSLFLRHLKGFGALGG